MAGYRRPLGIALALNTAVIMVELAGTLKANSLSLLLDAVHNVSDELALAFLLLACVLEKGLSAGLLRAANLLNSMGMLAVCAVMFWEIGERFRHPCPLEGSVPVVAGLAGALFNWGVAKVLQNAAQKDASIRLAYAHNLGDTLVSLAPVVAGAMAVATGRPIFDPIAASAIAIMIAVTTVQSFAASYKTVAWRESNENEKTERERFGAADPA